MSETYEIRTATLSDLGVVSVCLDEVEWTLEDDSDDMGRAYRAAGTVRAEVRFERNEALATLSFSVNRDGTVEYTDDLDIDEFVADDDDELAVSRALEAMARSVMDGVAAEITEVLGSDYADEASDFMYDESNSESYPSIYCRPWP